MAIAKTAYLWENGRVVMSGPADVIADNPDVKNAYLGGDHAVDYLAVKHYRMRKRWLS